MAGLKFRLADEDRSQHAIGIVPAAPEDIAGFFLFDGDVKKAARNLVDIDSVSRVVGSPGDMGGYMHFKGMSDYIQTDVPETDAMSFMVVARTTENGAAPATQPMYVSNFGSPSAVAGVATFGVSMFVSGASAIAQTRTRFTDEGTTTSSGTTLSSNANASWACYCSRLRPSRVEIRNLTSGQASGNPLDFPRVLSTGKMRIGSSFKTEYMGASDIAAVLIWNEYISDAAYEAQYLQLQEIMAVSGITI